MAAIYINIWEEALKFQILMEKKIKLVWTKQQIQFQARVQNKRHFRPKWLKNCLL